MTLFWFSFSVAVAATIVALVDGFLRLGRRGAALGVVEVFLGFFYLLSLGWLLVPFPGDATPRFVPFVVIAISLAVVMVIGLVRPSRGSRALPILGVVLIVLWFALTLRWIVVPGLP